MKPARVTKKASCVTTSFLPSADTAADMRADRDTPLDCLQRIDATLERILDVLLDARRAPSRSVVATPIDDGRGERLLDVIVCALDGGDLPFTSAEVAAAAALDDDLRQALGACGATDSASVGALFRTLRDQPIGPYRLRRDARDWRIDGA